MKKKLLSLLLVFVMLLSAVPVMSISASADTLVVSYTLVLAADKGYQNSTGGTQVNLANMGISVTGNAQTGYTYNFNNVDFVTSAATAIQFENNATIILTGNNEFLGGDSDQGNAYGINIDDYDLTIGGEGNLTLAVGSSLNHQCHGIQTEKSVTINSGNITVDVGNATDSIHGIYCESFTMKKGSVNVRTGNAEYENGCASNYGIACVETFVMESGTINAAAGNVTVTASNEATSLGVSAESITLIDGTITASSGSVSGDPNESLSAAVSASSISDVKAVNTDTQAELTFDEESGCFKEGANIATKVTLTPKSTTNYTLVLAADKGYQNSTGGTEVNLSDLGITVSGNTQTGYTYNFNNVNFVTAAPCAIDFCNKATIVLTGNNVVTCGDSKQDDVYGISIEDYDLTIEGEGSLTLTTGSAPGGHCKGINSGADITVNSGTTKVTMGDAYSYSDGICCETLTMKQGNLEVKTGNVNYSMGGTSCYGVCCMTALVMEGGTLTAASGNVSTTSAGAESVGVMVGESLTLTGGTIIASSGSVSGNPSTDRTSAVSASSISDIKAVNTDTKAELTFDEISGCFKEGATIATKATLTTNKNFNLEKERICAALTELGETYDGCFATRDIRKAKEAVNNYQYDESKSYEENVAALEAIFTKTTEKVVKRHDFIYGCPFMTVFARFVEWILDILNITL